MSKFHINRLDVVCFQDSHGSFNSIVEGRAVMPHKQQPTMFDTPDVVLFMNEAILREFVDLCNKQFAQIDAKKKLGN